MRIFAGVKKSSVSIRNRFELIECTKRNCCHETVDCLYSRNGRNGQGRKTGRLARQADASGASDLASKLVLLVWCGMYVNQECGPGPNSEHWTTGNATLLSGGVALPRRSSGVCGVSTLNPAAQGRTGNEGVVLRIAAS